MLCQLDHRGGQGSDPHTGDGAGIMMQIPDAFFKKSAPVSTCLKKDATASG